VPETIADFKLRELIDALCICQCGWSTPMEGFAYQQAREIVARHVKKLKEKSWAEG